MYQVLIVDDEIEERDGIEYLLQIGKYPVQAQKSENGLEALAFLKENRVDLLIADVKMPFMDGLSLCAQAKQLYPDILLMISSAYGDFEYMQKAIQCHVDAYILKPVVVAEFNTAIERMLEILDRRKTVWEKQQKLLEEYKNGNYYEREKLLETFLGESDKLDTDVPETTENAAITRAIALIRENYQKDIGLEWVAQQVYLSAGYLSGLFKRETGKSIIQYITILRMEKARELLTQTNRKIADIAQAVGYSNTSYFCLLFRKYYGVTAHQMQEQEAGK